MLETRRSHCVHVHASTDCCVPAFRPHSSQHAQARQPAGGDQDGPRGGVRRAGGQARQGAAAFCCESVLLHFYRLHICLFASAWRAPSMFFLPTLFIHPCHPASQGKDEGGKEVRDYWKPSVALLNDRWAGVRKGVEPPPTPRRFVHAPTVLTCANSPASRMYHPIAPRQGVPAQAQGLRQGQHTAEVSLSLFVGATTCFASLAPLCLICA